jgi:transposase-like protein
MRYPASEKLEIIRLVEQSYLPIKRTLDKLGIPRTTFYRWYDCYQTGGPEALKDRSPRPSRVFMQSLELYDFTTEFRRNADMITREFWKNDT